MPMSGVDATAAPYQIRILRPLALYVRDTYGPEALVKSARAARIAENAFEGATHWLTIDQFEAFVASVREQCADDSEFRKACTHRLAEGYGPLRFVTWAASPLTVYRVSVATYHLVSKNGRVEVLSQGPASIHIRLSDAKTSRLTCIVRQEQTAALPTLWGQSPATLREEGCIARGDASCDFHFRWYPTRSWLPIFVGAALGTVALFFHGPWVRWALPLLGAALGYIWDHRRLERENRARREDMAKALETVGEEEAAARRELMAFHQRQKDYTRTLEEEMAERDASIERILARTKQVDADRTIKLLGFSHDLRNPLSLMTSNTSWLKENMSLLGDEGPSLIQEFEYSISQMKRMLGELMDLARSKRALVALAPQPVVVAELSERLGRRLRALVHARDIRPSVFTTREAPDQVELDPLLFDRVTDNLLTNAAKYTERGSIIVELGGVPGFLVVKVSDTGRGIADSDLQRTFVPEGSDPRRRANDSYGVGLSVVVRLLGSVGGRLEVMSRAGKGTTFWVYFPERMAATQPANDSAPPEKEEELLSRVVKIRKAQA
jgi:signal transduction histidine kinase